MKLKVKAKSGKRQSCNITLPVELVAQMAIYPLDVSWSRIAEIAFRNYLIANPCPPSPTPSSPSTVPAPSAVAPATQPPAAPPVELGQLSAEQLQHLDTLLLGARGTLFSGNLSMIDWVTCVGLLWKIVRPAAMKAAGISSSEPTPKQKD